MRGVWVAVVALLSGCLKDNGVACGDLTCPNVLVCSPDQTCVSRSQIAACEGSQDGVPCTFDAEHGFCHHEVCVTTLDMCGDGVSSIPLGELCDCGDPQVLRAPPTGCRTFNSTAPGATCRPSCLPARCGDGVTDTSEGCDDANNLSGDGCSADCRGRFDKMQTPSAWQQFDAFMLAPDDVYVTETGSVLHWNGTTWTTIPLLTGVPMFAVWASGPTDVYVGGASALVHYDGTTATLISGTLIGPVYAIWGSGPNNVYVVGGNGLIIHFDGAAWAPVVLPAQCPLDDWFGLAGSGSDVWIGGANGICHGTSPTTFSPYDTGGTQQLIHANGQLYSVSTSTITMFPATGPKTAIAAPGQVEALGVISPTQLITVGFGGVILQYDTPTQTWTHLVAPTEAHLHRVVSSGPTNVFIVGDGGTILH